MFSRKPAWKIIQIPILRFTGFIPYHDGNNSWKTLSVQRKIFVLAGCVISWSILLGTAVFASLKIAEVGYGFRSYFPGVTSTDKKRSTILDVFFYLPDGAINVRCFLVLAIFHAKRHSFNELSDNIFTLVETFFEDAEVKQALYRKIKKTSLILMVSTTMIFLAWPLIVWPETLASINGTLQSEINTPPIPLNLAHWQFLFIEIFFRHLPYILSQQVYLCAIVFSLFLSEVLTVMSREIKAETALNNEQFPSSSKKRLHGIDDWKLRRWKDAYVRLMVINRSVNEHFDFIFLLTYSLDFLAVLGSASWLLTGDEKSSVLYYVSSFTGILVFGAFATLLPLPFVIFHEKVELFQLNWQLSCNQSSSLHVSIQCSKRGVVPLVGDGYPLHMAKETSFAIFSIVSMMTELTFGR